MRKALAILFLLILAGCATTSNRPPVAVLKANPTSGYVPLLVTFNISGSYDPDGLVVSYSLDFGDGTTPAVGGDLTRSITHTYTRVGTFTATLTVIDNDGATNQSSVIITVAPPNQPPVAVIDVTLAAGAVPFTVTFDGSRSSDPDGQIVNYVWDFGDGNTAIGKIVNHTYDRPGIYYATLTVTDNEGATADASVKITGLAFVLRSISAPHGPAAIVSNDFNRDNIPDIATADGGDTTFSIFLSNGDGTFQTTTFTGQCGHWSIASADINKDGNADIILPEGCFLNSAILILLGNGDGTFQPAINIPVDCTGAWGLITNDFNNDDNTDIALADVNRSEVLVFLGNGDGTFESARRLQLNSAFPIDLTSADFNNDGNQDIATMNAAYWGAPPSISILLGNGDGTFQAGVNIVIDSPSQTIVSADFNNDGNSDLATGPLGLLGKIFIFAGRGDGTFDLINTIKFESNNDEIISCDVDGDDLLDLVVVTYSTASIFLGKGGGAFEPPINFNLGNGDSADDEATCADFDIDGHLDLAIVDRYNRIDVLINELP